MPVSKGSAAAAPVTADPTAVERSVTCFKGMLTAIENAACITYLEEAAFQCGTAVCPVEPPPECPAECRQALSGIDFTRDCHDIYMDFAAMRGYSAFM